MDKRQDFKTHIIYESFIPVLIDSLQKFHNGYGNVRKKNGLFNYGLKMVKQQRIKPHHILDSMHDCAEKSFTSLNTGGQIKNDTYFLGTV